MTRADDLAELAARVEAIEKAREEEWLIRERDKARVSAIIWLVGGIVFLATTLPPTIKSWAELVQ